MDTYLAIIQYQTEADQVMLVQNTNQIFAYFEDPITGVNVMLSTVNDTHLSVLRANGYFVQIVEKNPNMNQYRLFHHNSPGQGKEYANAGEIYMLTAQDTLVRIHDNTATETITTNGGTTVVPFINVREELAEKNNVDLAMEKAQAELTLYPTAPELNNEEASGERISFLLGMIMLCVVLIIAVFIFWKKMKTGNN